MLRLRNGSDAWTLDDTLINNSLLAIHLHNKEIVTEVEEALMEEVQNQQHCIHSHLCVRGEASGN